MLRIKLNIDNLQGKVIYILILVALVQFAYPISLRGGIYLIIYQIFYSAMFIAGIYLGSQSKLYISITGTLALLFLGFGIAFALDPTDITKILVTYVVLIPYLAAVIYVLLRYIFLSSYVSRDVLYAATAVYLLLGALFVPIYGILETVNPGAFIDNAMPEMAVQWQQFIYYSYATLTTLGYGDILPVSAWARSFASFESIIGVLYIAIMMARLVGLYTMKD